MVVKHQGFCFTHNNWTPEDVERLKTCQDMKFLVFGYELAPTTGTPHLQGFFWTHVPKTPQQMKRKLIGTVILIPGKNKPPSYWVTDDGVNGVGYCFKEHQPGWVLQGQMPTLEEYIAQCPKGQGARTDIVECKRKIDAGMHYEALMGEDDHFATMAQHRKFFAEYQSYAKRRKKFDKPYVEVIYGDTGCNKSRRVYDAYDIDDLYVWGPHQGQWFDGYAGQSVVLFDEFRGQIPWGQLLQLTDGYPGVKVQVKGGMVYWSPKYIYFTSPKHPRDWYQNTTDDKYAQFERRVMKITHAIKGEGSEE